MERLYLWKLVVTAQCLAIFKKKENTTWDLIPISEAEQNVYHAKRCAKFCSC